ncbi:uncharacterized protein [Solanum lycopersicum]|uniref:uncharacterized protein n=1 Tax=Solanum lycopersicum TaxID=4081 RepID=UPI003747CEB8
MPIPTWKWERITIDFVVGLPTTVGGYDSIWVVVDRLTKSAHFIPVRVKYTTEKLVELYISQIMRLHGVPVSIISIQVHYLLLTSGRNYNMVWVPKMDSLDTHLLRDAMEKVRMIQNRLLTAQSRQKSYADRRVRALVFMEGDHVWIRVSPMKGVMRFGKKGKSSPRFIVPFEILSRVGEVAYKLSLPPSLSAVHPVFHVSMLRKYIPDESHVLSLDFVDGVDLRLVGLIRQRRTLWT